MFATFIFPSTLGHGYHPLIKVPSPNTALARQSKKSGREHSTHSFAPVIAAPTLSMVLRLLTSSDRVFGVNSVQYAAQHLSPPCSREGRLARLCFAPTRVSERHGRFRCGREKEPKSRIWTCWTANGKDCSTPLMHTLEPRSPYLLVIVSRLSKELSTAVYAVSRRQNAARDSQNPGFCDTRMRKYSRETIPDLWQTWSFTVWRMVSLELPIPKTRY